MNEPILFSEMKKNEDKITYLLEKYPRLRDSDEMLFATLVMMQEGNGVIGDGVKRLSVLSGFDVLQSIIDNKYVNYTSMIRCRRLVQNKRTDLRGTSYERRNDSDDYFRNNINK